MVYIWLALAIMAELAATSLLRINSNAAGFQPLLLLGIVVFYVISFFSLGKTMPTLPTGVTYAIWSGAGIFVLTLMDRFVYHIHFSWQSYAALALIFIGIAWLNLLNSH